jgi:peptidyl-prolyl cis-trans isomerase B (cyclophilin B)
MAPPSARRNNNPLLWIAAGVAAVVVLGGLIYLYGTSSGAGASPSPSTVAVHSPTTTINQALVHAPAATPLASAPAAPGGDGTMATIQTDLGNITIQIYNQSAPVASENFINLANAGYYNGLTFHRIVPNFVIQGGDPAGNGSGGPGYTIPDEPVVGNYTRGIVAMARTSDPNSAGSQFFIVLDDSVAQSLPKSGDYVIFGKVTSGLSVVDQIAATPNSGSPNNLAIDPVVMDLVTVQPAGV